MNTSSDKYLIDTDAAVIYRSIYSARRDLSIAKEALSIFSFSDDARSSGLDDVEESLWTTAIIRYGRAKKGYKSTEQLSAWNGLSKAQIEMDAEIMLLRDRMYAHAVGIGEDHQVYAEIRHDFYGNLRAYSVGINNERIVSWGYEKASLYVDFLDFLINRMWELEFYWRDNLLGQLQAMGEADLKKLKRFRPTLYMDFDSSLYRGQIEKYRRKR